VWWKGWRIDIKDAIDNDLKPRLAMRRARRAARKSQDAAIAAALAARASAQRALAARIASGDFVGADDVAEYRRKAAAAREAHLKLVGGEGDASAAA
jgi:hypothetical protein